MRWCVRSSFKNLNHHLHTGLVLHGLSAELLGSMLTWPLSAEMTTCGTQGTHHLHPVRALPNWMHSASMQDC